MEFAKLTELLTQFDESSIREFDLNTGDFHLYLSKNEQSAKTTQAVSVPAPVASPEPAVKASEDVPTPPVAVETGQTVDSPLVGVAYLSGAPGESVFKQVGDSVAVGETLCIVEAMKIMNEINSDVAGTVTEVLIQNEDVVEYGQPLFRIV